MDDREVDTLQLLTLIIDNFESVNYTLDDIHRSLKKKVQKWKKKGNISLDDCFRLADTLNYKYCINYNQYSRYINRVYTMYGIYCYINGLRVKKINNRKELIDMVNKSKKNWLELSDELFMKIEKEKYNLYFIS